MRVKSNLFVLLILFITTACEDILETDISDVTVAIISPTENQQLTSNVVNFQWEEVDGAQQYRIQVFRPDSGIVIDSIVEQTNLEHPISPGNYQWRIRAENSAYQSAYSFNRNFSVIVTTDLTNQTVLLTAPINDFYTNVYNVNLSWETLTSATSYNFELVNVTNGEQIINQQTGLTASTLNIGASILNANAQYRWRVKAVNSTSQTIYSNRTFYIDSNPPNAAIDLIPANNQNVSVNQPTTFTWNTPTDYGPIQSPISYIVEFSNTANFSTIIQTSQVQTNSFQQTFTAGEDLYWRVRTRDLAGNSGVNSVVHKLIVN